MRVIFFGILLLAGCASPRSRDPLMNGEAREDHDFFYGHIWKAAPSEEDTTDHKFFYGF